jgi:hypothetical protein
MKADDWNAVTASITNCVDKEKIQEDFAPFVFPEDRDRSPRCWWRI